MNMLMGVYFYLTSQFFGTFINELSTELESWLCSFALMNVSVRVMNSIRCRSSLPEKLVFKRNESTAWVSRM